MGQGGMPYQVARAVGDYGEQVACDYLVQAGYEIVDRNWRCAGGELDVVARQDGVLVFCEVKTRRSTRFGTPAEAVTRPKAARLRRLAVAWLRAHRQHADGLRIDVVSVLLQPSGPARVEHLQGVA